MDGLRTSFVFVSNRWFEISATMSSTRLKIIILYCKQLGSVNQFDERTQEANLI